MTYRSSLVLVASLLAVSCTTPAPPPAVTEPGAAPEVVPVDVTRIPAPSASASGSAAPALSEATKPPSAPASALAPASAPAPAVKK